MLLRVAYDGGAFHGYQRQRGLRTVQGELEAALARIAPDVVEVRGASRTDAGVHAEDQVVAFDTTSGIPPHGFAMQINAALPEDLAVRHAEPCIPGFTPRFHAREKWYRYVVRVDAMRDPLRDRHAWHLTPQNARRAIPGRTRDVHDWLDVYAMRRAARSLLGRHDFQAFRAADDPRDNTIRTLFALDISPGYRGDPNALAITVHGNAFMKNMVRILAGTLVEVGRGHLPDDLSALLRPDAKRAAAGPTAPARGLTLARIRLRR